MTTGLRHLEKWRRILKYSECFLMLTEVVKQILAKPVIWMGWNNGGRDEIKYSESLFADVPNQFNACLASSRLLRPEVLLASVLWEETDAINQAKQLLHNFLTNGSVIPANLREVSGLSSGEEEKSRFPSVCSQVVYTGAVLSGEYTFWQYCWDRYITLRGSPEGTTERLQLLRALGKTKDAW